LVVVVVVAGVVAAAARHGGVAGRRAEVVLGALDFDVERRRRVSSWVSPSSSSSRK